MSIKKSGPAIVTAFGLAAAFVIQYAVTPALAQLSEAAEIEGVQEQYRQAWQRGDLDAVMQFWTPDAKDIGPGAVASGAAAIRASLAQSMAMGVYDLRNEDREVFGSGATVVENTRSVLFDRSGKAILTLRYMTLWQKSGGRWRIHREMVIPVNTPQQP